MADLQQLTHAPEFFELQRALAGRYSLVRELGRGGMGIVFLARDLSLERLVAIKLLPPSLTRDAAWRERFLREARLAAQLAHPNIVPIHDVAVSHDLAYFVMGYIEGESLGARVRGRGPMTPASVARMVQEVAWALGHAHAHGIIHRDVKPDNILLERDSGRALVTDFGIAHNHEGTTPVDGALVGTPQYMSPELLRGERADAQSDLFALGVTAWFALTGRHPVEAGSLPELFTRQAHDPLPIIRSVIPSLPIGVAEAIDRMLGAGAAERPSSADALASMLDAARARLPLVPPPVRDFIRHALAAGDDIQSAFVGLGSSALLVAVVGKVSGGAGTGFAAGMDNFFAGLIGVTLGLFFVGLGLVRFGGVVAGARELVREGYDLSDVEAALVNLDAEASEPVSPDRRAERRRRAWWYGLTMTAKTAVALYLATLDRPAWVYLPAAVLAVLLPAYGMRHLVSLLRTEPGLWSRLLRGRLGKWVFRAARLFQEKALPVSRPVPTVFALAEEVDAGIRALPAGARAHLGELTQAVRRLRAEASRLEERREDHSSDRRLLEIALELDTVRLELLAMRTGAMPLEDVTGHIDRARALSERVDGVLGG